MWGISPDLPNWIFSKFERRPPSKTEKRVALSIRLLGDRKYRINLLNIFIIRYYSSQEELADIFHWRKSNNKLLGSLKNNNERLHYNSINLHLRWKRGMPHVKEYGPTEVSFRHLLLHCAKLSELFPQPPPWLCCVPSADPIAHLLHHSAISL